MEIKGPSDYGSIRVNLQGSPEAMAYWKSKLLRFLEGQWCVTQSHDPSSFSIYPNADND